jgi:voltage-gated potassium channel
MRSISTDDSMTPPLTTSASEALDRRLHAPGKRLFIGGERSVRRALATRTAIVFVMFFAVVLLFWFDRDGLRDNADDHLSFIDIVYFSVVTVTTVGYGDITPVTTRARLIDAALVTPIRLFIWLIFLGTAYQLVLQRLIEDLRMRALQAKLQNHVIICGFGHAGRCAAAELIARGFEKREILVVDVLQARLEDAAERGYVGLLSDARNEETLRRAMVHTARALFVCTDRDDTNVLIVLTARNLAPAVRIVARVEEAENEKIVRQSGADAAVLPSRVGGILMADSLDTSAIASAVMDLISAGGGVTLIERDARQDEIGRMPREIAGELVVRVIRDGRTVAFWEEEARIRGADRLVTITPVMPKRA